MLGLARCMTGEGALAHRSALEDRIRSGESADRAFRNASDRWTGVDPSAQRRAGRARVEAERHAACWRPGDRRPQHARPGARTCRACAHLHALAISHDAPHRFAQRSKTRYVLETRAAIDALAGLALTQQLMQQPDAAARRCSELDEFARELNEPMPVRRPFLPGPTRVCCRVSLHRRLIGQGSLIEHRPPRRVPVVGGSLDHPGEGPDRGRAGAGLRRRPSSLDDLRQRS